jgi:AraC-like DNA-binding protein
LSELDALMQDGGELPRPLTLVDLLKQGRRHSRGSLGALHDAIDLCLMDGSTEIDAVARLLDLAPRTLQRRLALHGVTYREMLQETRRRRAASLLLETGRPIKTIAADLGYGEAENFTRAFRTWHGCAPSEFRATAGGMGHRQTGAPGSNVAK